MGRIKYFIRDQKYKKYQKLSKEFLVMLPPEIHFVERDVEKICSSFFVESDLVHKLPIDYVKRKIAYQIADHIIPHINLEKVSDYNGVRYVGSLYLAKDMR